MVRQQAKTEEASVPVTAMEEKDGRKSRFCEVTPQLPPRMRSATVHIELGNDIILEIRNADRSLLEGYMLEVLTGL